MECFRCGLLSAATKGGGGFRLRLGPEVLSMPTWRAGQCSQQAHGLLSLIFLLKFSLSHPTHAGARRLLHNQGGLLVRTLFVDPVGETSLGSA